MKLKPFLWTILMLTVLVAAACVPVATPVVPSATPVPPEPTLAPATEQVDGGPVVLTVVGMQETLTFTMDQLKALTATSGQAGMKSSTGKITVPALFTGVLLTDLLEMVDGLSPEYGVSVVAEDGYAMTLSYEQITNGEFITYDPSDGSEKQLDDSLRAMLAYGMEGEPLNADRDGTLRMVVISERNNQVTDGHWSVKWVNRIEVQPLVKEWTLHLSGAVDEVIDRNTFQSCGAASCHLTSWTDDEGQVWEGVPLYLLAGRVDDEISHEGPAYNRDHATAGYEIELAAADGYTTSVESADIYYNRHILVAYLVDGSPLPDKYFPLRLVGDDLDSSQRIGALAEIHLLMDEILAAQPTPQTSEPAETGEIPAGTTLWITGLVINPLALNDTSIGLLEVVQLTTEHPKKGATDYEGIRLNVLLGLASPLDGANQLILTASDGYSVAMSLADVQSCTDCLIAFTDETGVYSLVMPGFESGFWVKNIFKLEVQ